MTTPVIILFIVLGLMGLILLALMVMVVLGNKGQHYMENQAMRDPRIQENDINAFIQTTQCYAAKDLEGNEHPISGVLKKYEQFRRDRHQLVSN